MNVWNLQLLRIILQHFWPVAKHQNFVSAVRVLFQQILQNLELLRIRRVNQLTRICLPIRIHKLFRHITQYLHAIRLCQTPLVHQVQPVLLIKLRSNHEKQIINFLILPIRSCRQSDFQIKLVLSQDLLESLCWEFVDFVRNADAPWDLLRLW